MKVTLLGTGAPAPSLKRACSGYLFELGADVVVIDHGPGAHQRLLEAGFQATDVTHFLASHYHYDHIMDYPRLLLTRWDHGGPGLAPLKVFGPPPLAEVNARFVGPEGAFALDIAARRESPASLAVFQARGGTGARPHPAPVLTELAPGDVIDGDGWRIRVGPARHVQPCLDCLSFRVETATASVVYSGDSGGVFDPFIDFAKGADVLIQMNHFLSGTEPTPDYRRMSGSHLDNAETARRAGVGLLVLTHFLPALDRPGVRERMVTEMAEIFHGPIILGEDLMQVPQRLDPPGAAD